MKLDRILSLDFELVGFLRICKEAIDKDKIDLNSFLLLISSLVAPPNEHKRDLICREFLTICDKKINSFITENLNEMAEFEYDDESKKEIIDFKIKELSLPDEIYTLLKKIDPTLFNFKQHITRAVQEYVDTYNNPQK